MLLIFFLLKSLVFHGSLHPDMFRSDIQPSPVDVAPFQVTECSPPARSFLLDRLQNDFAPTLDSAELEEAYCIDPAGFQASEFEIALLRAGTAVDPGGMPPIAGDGGEAAWVLRNVFQTRPELQPSLVTEWFLRFSPSGSFEGIARYPNGQTAIIYYRD